MTPKGLSRARFRRRRPHAAPPRRFVYVGLDVRPDDPNAIGSWSLSPRRVPDTGAPYYVQIPVLSGSGQITIRIGASVEIRRYEDGCLVENVFAEVPR